MSDHSRTKEVPFRGGATLWVKSETEIEVRILKKDGSWDIHEITDIETIRKVLEIFGAHKK